VWKRKKKGGKRLGYREKSRGKSVAEGGGKRGERGHFIKGVRNGGEEGRHSCGQKRKEEIALRRKESFLCAGSSGERPEPVVDAIDRGGEKIINQQKGEGEWHRGKRGGVHRFRAKKERKDWKTQVGSPGKLGRS